jgi:capsular polysaccharide biosynthesis protein
VTTAVIGLVSGLALSIVLPKKYTATTTLLLAHPSGQDPAKDMATDGALLKTRAVSAAAVTRLRLHAAPDSLLKSYTGAVLSDDVLRITASAPTSGEAVRRADAIAGAFLALRASEMQAQLASVVDILETQENQLNTQLAQITERINASPQGVTGNAASAFDDLVASRAATASSIAQIQNEIQNANLSTTSVINGSSVVDPASATRLARIKPKATRAAAGMLAGLALGLGWVTLVAVGSSRVRRREDIAASLGAPVGLSLRSTGRRKLRSHPGTELVRPPRYVKRLARHLRAEMRPRTDGSGAGGTSGGDQVARHRRAVHPSLAIVAVDRMDAPSMGVFCLASDLAQEGRRVVIADLSEGSALVTGLTGHRLVKSRSRSTEINQRDRWPVLQGDVRVVTPTTEDLDEMSSWWWADPVSGEVGQASEADLHAWAEVVIVFATVEPMIGAEGMARWSRHAVVTVTAGQSTGARLHAVAELMRAANVDIRSVVLLGSDQTDDSSGAAVVRQRPATRSRASLIDRDVL